MTGEILFLAHRAPFPPDRGDRIRSFHVLRRLRELATVRVGAIGEKAGSRQDDIFIAPRPPRLRTGFRGVARGVPLSVAAFEAAAMHAFVARTLVERPIDTIYAFSGQMAQYVPSDFAGRAIIDFADVDSAKFAAYAATDRGLRRWLYAREARLLARYEGEAARRAGLSLFVSDAEASLFRASHPEAPVAALENGVDLAFFNPATPPVDASNAPLILFTGQMDYRPNVEAVTGFARQVLPLVRACIPSARFAIVGRDPVAEVIRLDGDGVIVTGEVADVRPWLARADVVVAPLTLARGIQNKVLEAMAMARPAVVSQAAFEGIDARDGRELIVADAPADQAEAIATLLADSARATAIGREARARVEARYAWDAVLAPLAAMVGRGETGIGQRAASR